MTLFLSSSARSLSSTPKKTFFNACTHSLTLLAYSHSPPHFFNNSSDFPALVRCLVHTVEQARPELEDDVCSVLLPLIFCLTYQAKPRYQTPWEDLLNWLIHQLLLLRD